MAKSKKQRAPVEPGQLAEGFVVSEPAPVLPEVEQPAVLVLQAGPNASEGSFAMRISDDIRLELPRGEQVTVPAMLEYEAICKARGPDLGKRISKTVDVAWLLAKAFRFGLVEWVNRPAAPPRQPRVPT